MWNLFQPSRLDRNAIQREDIDLSTLPAVYVRDGAVLVRGNRLVRVPAADVVAGPWQAYLGQVGGQGIRAINPQEPIPYEFDGISGAQFVPLREFLQKVSHVDNEFNAAGEGVAYIADLDLAFTAVALQTWHTNSLHCGRCGGKTETAESGWSVRCRKCAAVHYPRTDPAVIVAITDPEQRLLLAHAAHWSDRRYSHLAGYVEPGESLEQAVHREVAEEAGITVTDLRYFGSQSWPFPASIMMGFTASTNDLALAVDGVEITHAQFVTRAEYAVKESCGEIVPPPVGSIARRLLDNWLHP